MDTASREEHPSLRVLIVEDDPTLRRLVSRGLERHADVMSAGTGREAIDLAQEHHYDAVASDISLPDMSGLDVIAAIRETQPAAGIVAITGNVDVDIAVGSMKAGGDDFLAKPFDIEILWHMLQRALDSRARRIAAEEAVAYRTLAYTDALTDTHNRRYIDEYLEDAVAHARERATPLTVAFLDVDNFKLFNDYMGHHEGDQLLRRIATSLEGRIDAPAVFGRYGGDEFVAVFPGSDLETAERALAPARRLTSSIDVVTGTNIALPVRLSVGIAQLRGEESPRDLVARAENAMYLDKAVAPALLAGGVDAALTDLTMESVATLKALRGLVQAIDRRDSYTRYHSDHATNLCLRLAAKLDLSQAHRNAIVLGGPVHDLGKIAVPDDILWKPGPLTSDERRTMEAHPVMGAAITAAVMDQDAVVDLVRHHHERFDGTGYPNGLRGHAIALPTRLFSMADAYSAMTTDRPYRKGLTQERALEEMERGAGTQFDPELVPAFLETVLEEGTSSARPIPLRGQAERVIAS